MHEFHLMRQVVHLVETVLQEAGAGRAAIVRVAVRPGGHVWHEPQAMQTAFAAAAQGTAAEGAALEIIRESVQCSVCGAPREWNQDGPATPCGTCGSDELVPLSEPEVRLQDVVVKA